LKKYKFILQGLKCPNCAGKIEQTVSKEDGIKNVVLNFNTSKLSFETDRQQVKELVKQIVFKIEPEVEVIEEGEIKEVKNNIVPILRLIIGVVLALIGGFASLPLYLNDILIIFAYVILLYRTFKTAVKLIIKSKTINENFLITISCIGAYLVGEHMEGLMVIILYEIGKILEEKAVNKSRKSIKELMNIKAEYANLKTKDKIEKVMPETVNIGDIVIVKQGEKVPLDGVIIKGTASLDIAALTGESILKEVKENDEILSGSIVVDGIIEFKVTEKYENSTVNRILELVENATDKKAKTETFVAKAARIYTPAVFGLAILVAVFMPLVIPNVTYSQSIYKALIFLVISCPCAIAISVPLSYFSGIGRASKAGILIKGSDYLDGIKDIKEIIFDKTGTLTTGNFNVSKINSLVEEFCEQDILRYVGIGERYSNHPIAKSILNKIDFNIDDIEIEEYEEVAGKGIQYKLEGNEIKIGNISFVAGKEEMQEDGTVLYVSKNGDIIGNIVIKDEIKDGAKETIINLNKLGIKTKMFTGDKKEVAEKIGKELGIIEINSEMLPDDKYKELEKIIEKYKETNSKVAFVGDGINDSPVLALSDIGISMGGIGTDAAIEASDVVIMTDELGKILEAVKISKKTNFIIKQNLIFAIGTKGLILILSILGLAGMWQAIFADVGVTLMTILNTLRILKK